MRKARHGIWRRPVSLLLSMVLCLSAPYAGQSVTKVQAADSGKVVFADFEDAAFTGSDKGNQITQNPSFVREGKQSLLYARNSANGVYGVAVKSVSGSAINVSGMSKIAIDVYDTMGNNNFAVKLTDTSGMSKEIWGSSAVKDTWAVAEVPLSSYTGIDLTAIEKVEIYEWNDGTYYMDNIRFEDASMNQIVFQNFENSMAISNPTDNKIVSTEKRGGSNSLLYHQGADVVIETGNKNGVDATGKAYMVMWIKDTNGSNNFELQLTDANGNTSQGGYWTASKSVQNEWAEIVVPMSDFAASPLDKSRITKVKMWEYNTGNYYIDDISFTNVLPPAAPTSNKAEQTYTQGFDVTLQAEPGASIYYTTDDSTPTVTSSLYTSPIAIAVSTTIKAIAVQNGESSRVSTWKYQIAGADLPAKVYLQDFENGAAPANGSVISTDAFTGGKSALYAVATSADPTEANSFYATVATPVDTSKYSYLVFWLKDTQGANTVKLQVVDANGNKTGLGWTNTLSNAGGKAIKNEWTEYAVKLSSISGIDKLDRTKITGVRIGEWNSGNYYIDDIYFANALLPATPVANYKSGTYASITDLTLTTTSADSKIYYTTDGTTPTKASSVYSAPIAITADTQVKAVTINTISQEMGRVADFSYRILPLPASGKVSFHTFDTGIANVSATTGAVITPNAQEKYNGAAGMTYELTTLSGTPEKNSRSMVIHPEGNRTSVDARKSKYLVFYVKDMQGCNNTHMFIKDKFGNEASGWTTASTVYGEWSQYYVDLSTMSGYANLDLAYLSEITFGFYNQGTYYMDEVYLTDTLYSGLPGGAQVTLDAGAGQVVSSVTPGEYSVFRAVELAAEEGAVIHYTLDGSTPTASSAAYSKAIYLSKSTTVKAVAVKDGVTSAVFAFAYKIRPSIVFATTGRPGTYDSSVIVALRSSEDNTPVYYTLDGSTPDYHSTRYTSYFKVEETTTIKAIAYTGTESLNYADGESSVVSSLDYVIAGTNGSINIPKASVAEGTYGGSKTVALSTKTSGATIYYTTNGRIPTKNASVYTGAITVDSSTTIKAVAVKGDVTSEVAEFNYIIDTRPSNFLKTDGAVVRNNYGTGEEVILRGTNAGGWLVTENWQCPVDAKDQLTTIRTFTERFGEQTAMELVNLYQNNWWTVKDFDLVKAEGINLLRLPVTYFEMLNADGTLKATAFERLDWFIKEAKKRDIYVMIDMHGAVGSQNGKDHSGDTTIADIGNFYGNEKNIQMTIELWKAIAKRYKDEPMVSGYDLLNEPSATGPVQFEVYDRIYKAIRAIDDNHIIYLQAIWNPDDLPNPSLYGWENVVYQYHFYNWTNLNDLATQEAFIKDKITQVNQANHGVPVMVGEFTFFANTDSWEKGLALFESQGWSWTTWTFKVSDAGEGSSWGLYTGLSDPVFVAKDSVNTVKEKWSKLATDQYFTRNAKYADVIKPFFAKNKPVLVPYKESTPEVPQNPARPAIPSAPGTETTPTAPENGSIPLPGIGVPAQVSVTCNEAQKQLLAKIQLPEAAILNQANVSKDTFALTVPVASVALMSEMGRGEATTTHVSILIPDSIRTNDKIEIASVKLEQGLISQAVKAGTELEISVQRENGMELYAWSFDKGDLLAFSKKKIAINLSLQLDRSDRNDGLDLHFEQQGVLPSQSQIKIYVADMIQDQDQSVYVYAYNTKTKKLEAIPDGAGQQIDKDGYLTLQVLKATEYVVLPEKAAGKDVVELKDQVQVTATKKTIYLNRTGQTAGGSINVVLPDTIANTKEVAITYATSNQRIATVDAKGKITGKKAGTVWIISSVTLEDGSTKKVKTKITVK